MTNSILSIIVLSLSDGISIFIGILLLNVSNSVDVGFSVVAHIINTLDSLSFVASPSLLNVPLSIKVNNISWPSAGSLWISSKNSIPPFAISKRPFLEDSAPV